MLITDDLRIRAYHPLIRPSALLQELPITNGIAQHIVKARKEAQAIIHGQDHRLLIVVGPCSVHDTTAALEYATRLKSVLPRYINQLHIVMRVYVGKPRTQIGWKGLINDPTLDGQFQINTGLRIARSLLLQINEMEIPTATEFLDTTIPHYLSDLVTWTAIGARTVESQIHRELASGLSMPVGFKNSTTGDVQTAIDAVLTAQHPHHFLGASKNGEAAILSTTGNPDGHLVLRGARHKTNYDPESIAAAIHQLQAHELSPRVMIDCSHGNCQKDYRRQIQVVDSVCQQITQGARNILGIMLESHLIAGKQALVRGQSLTYGQSITDACISWDETVTVLDQLATAIDKTSHSHASNYVAVK